MAAATNRAALLGVDTWTPRQLADRFATLPLANARQVPLSHRAREVLCARLLMEPDIRAQLGPLSAIADQPSCPRVLAKTLDELRLSEVTPAQLADHSPHLAALLAAYGAALDSYELADEHAVYNLACVGLQQQLRSLRYARVLLLDVPVRHQAEARLLRQLVITCDSLWTIPHGDQRTLAETRDFAPASGEGEAEPRAEPDAGQPQACYRLQQGLFAGTAQAGAADDSVIVLSAAGEERECAEIARQLLWAASSGTPFERMAVLPRRGSTYAPYLSESFSRAGIPAYFADRTRRPDESGRALLALLYCKAEGYRASRLAEFFALCGSAADLAHGSPAACPPHDDYVLPEEGLLGRPLAGPAEKTPQTASDKRTSPTRTTGRWERLLAEAAVVQGKERCMQRLHSLRAELRLRQQRTALSDSAGQCDPTGHQFDQVGDDLNHLDALIEHVDPLLQQLSTLPEQAPLTVWLPPLKALAQRALAEPERVLGVLSELRPMVGRHEVDTAPLDLDRIIFLLRTPLSELLQRDAPSSHGRVFIADARAARGLSFDLVCVPGLSEKGFPERVREDPLLLDSLRHKLSSQLDTQERRVDNERLYLRLAVGAAHQRLVLSYSRLDLERGRPRVPSFYLLEALRAAEGHLPSYDQLMQRAEAHAGQHSALPAPRDRALSIDACEYDLATLAQPLTTSDGAAPKGTDSTGAARYLLQTNSYLARALRARARRWTVRSYGPDDGMVVSAVPIRALLARYRPAARPYSATALAEYAHCPYRFYLRAVVNLTERPRPSTIDRMHPLHRASLINDCQFQLLQALRAERSEDSSGTSAAAPVQPLSDLAGLRSQLDRIVDDHAAAYRERLCPTVERVFDDGVARVRADLHAWLKQLATSPFVPLHAELGFGIEPSNHLDPQSQRAPVQLNCGLQLKGAIDLVDASGAVVRATSHHTGKARAPDGLRLAGGRHLQPLLYGLAIKTLFPHYPEHYGRLHYCTAQGRFETREVHIDARAEQDAADFANTLDEAVQSGMLPAAPEADACERCDYLPVCGPHEHERTQRKRKQQLSGLTALRRKP